MMFWDQNLTEKMEEPNSYYLLTVNPEDFQIIQ